jgi:adenosylcobinamide-phosphate synthase
MTELSATIFIAFFLDLLIGDPPYRGHPARVIGQSIHCFEGLMRRSGWDGRGGGILLVLMTGASTLVSYLVLDSVFFRLHPWLHFLFNLYLTYSLLALGDLLNHIKPVIASLEMGDLDRARKALSMMVGRDVQVLHEAGVGRAAVETLAENFVDGFLSPVFWFLAGGAISLFFGGSGITFSVSLMLLFKVASTLDSMVGYTDTSYVHFGWAGARLDDLMNFLPARLSIIFLFLGAGITRVHAMEGLRVALRDRLKHDSPNAAHAESFVAGALGIRLGGPTLYPEGMKTKPWLGDGTEEVGKGHIHRTMALLRGSALIVVLAVLSTLFFVYYVTTL